MKATTSTLFRKLRALPSLDWIVLALGLVVFSLLALHLITASSIWFDEAFGAYLVRFNFLDIARYTASDVHPPMYYWVLKIWVDFFGTTELAMRSLSVLFGTTTISFGFLLVKRLFGRRAAWVSLLLLIVSPMLIRYSQEARMYTMVAAIALSATFVLTFAVESKKRWLWVLYGILVSLGMWTHYFMAMVWLAHWAWRAVVTYQSGARGNKYRQAFFSKDWIIAHVVAVGLFLPWVPYMIVQLATIQGMGFWIGPLSADSLTNYMTNLLFYLEHDKAVGWYASALVVIVIMLGFFGLKLYQSLNIKQRQNYLLVVALAFVPLVLLFVLSLPPLRSSFIERYILPSIVGFSLFAGITLALGMAKLKAAWRVLAVGLIVVSMLFGVANVYHYGNFNKSSNIKVTVNDLVKQIKQRGQPGEPIIAESPWTFYEAVFYSTINHPVYFIDANVSYIYGSLDMLKDNDQHKIKDLAAFTKAHPVLWYIGYIADAGTNPLVSPDTSWKELQKFSIYDPISDKSPYKAVQFRTN